MGSEARKRARLFPLLLYHLLSTRTLPFCTIFFGVLSPILRRNGRASFAPGVKARTWGNYPRLKEYAYQMAFVFLLKPLKASLGKRRRLTNYLISYRFSRWKTGIKSVNLVVRFAGSSKG